MNFTIARSFLRRRRFIAAAGTLLAALFGGLAWLQLADETPEDRFIREWLTAQRRGVITAELQREAETVSTATLLVAARRMAEPDSPFNQTWRKVRAVLPPAVQRRVPVPFSSGRRAMALFSLMEGRVHEPGVVEALLGVITNRSAANRRIALLRLDSLLVVPAPMAEPLAALTNEPDYVLRAEIAATLNRAVPRTRTIEAALKELAADTNSIVRQAAIEPPDEDETEAPQETP
jgi:transposase InsO family protein